MGRYGGTANEDYFRWAYTALTRASKRLWHFRSPDFNYISRIVVKEIQRSANIKVSTCAESDDFCEARFQRIKSLCDKAAIEVTEDQSRQYEHRLTFTDAQGERAVISLWYKAKGYNGKDRLLQSSSEDFALLCRSIVDDTFAPVSVPFSSPDRPFAEKLVAFVNHSWKS